WWSWRGRRFQLRIDRRRGRRLGDGDAELRQRALRFAAGERKEAAVVPDLPVQLDRGRLVASGSLLTGVAHVAVHGLVARRELVAQHPLDGFGMSVVHSPD